MINLDLKNYDLVSLEKLYFSYHFNDAQTARVLDIGDEANILGSCKMRELIDHVGVTLAPAVNSIQDKKRLYHVLNTLSEEVNRSDAILVDQKKTMSFLQKFELFLRQLFGNQSWTAPHAKRVEALYTYTQISDSDLNGLIKSFEAVASDSLAILDGSNPENPSYQKFQATLAEFNALESFEQWESVLTPLEKSNSAFVKEILQSLDNEMLQAWNNWVISEQTQSET